MCIGLWSLEHPKYALVICTNRDEYLSRPTSHAHFHSFGELPENSSCTEDLFVLSGRDLQAGGSWFGINREGRVALLTNITEETTRSYSSSRGQLVSSFLQPERLNVDDYVRDLTNKEPSADYAGFNLVLFSPSSSSSSSSGTADEPLSFNASLVTNSGGGGVITSRPLRSEERCAGGVSNGVDARDGQNWPKVVHGRGTLGSLLHTNSEEDCSEDELVEELFSLLAWQPPAPPSNRSQLRTSIQIAPIAMTASLHPEAQPHPNAEPHHYYGTRLSTVLLVSKDGRVRFIERDIWTLAGDKVQPANELEHEHEEHRRNEGSKEDEVIEKEDHDRDEIVIRGDPRAQREYRFILAGKSSG